MPSMIPSVRFTGSRHKRAPRRDSPLPRVISLVFALATGLSACSGSDETPEHTQIPATVNPAAPRIVAFSDVHGDIEAARAALRLAGAIDDEDRWIGGDLVVVQTGDQLDRGDEIGRAHV